MWHGANIVAATISGIERIIIPLNKNNTDGIIDNANALNTPFFLKHIAHIRQYAKTRIESTIRYTVSPPSKKKPKYVYCTLNIIAIRELNYSSLKVVFFAPCGKSLFEVRQVRLHKPLPQWSKKYDFKVQSILTAINLGKSRQTNAVILAVLQESLTPILQIFRR